MAVDYYNKIRSFIFFRALIVTILFGAFHVIELDYTDIRSPKAIYYIIALLYFLTIIYAIFLKWIKNFVRFAYFQIITDSLIGCILMALTGGVESLFVFLFLLNIISTSILLNQRASFIIAGLCSVLYILIGILQYYKMITMFMPRSLLTFKEYIYNVFIHTNSFFIVAYLSSYPFEKLKKITHSLEQRDIDLDVLRAFNQNIIDNIPCGLLSTDVNGKIVVFNRAARMITCKSLSEVIGKPPEDIFPFIRSMQSEKIRLEGELVCDTKPKTIGMSFSKLEDRNGQLSGIIGIFQDLTNIKTLEEEVRQKEKLAAIGELSAGLAHELRNPLASLKGSIEMLKEGKLSPFHANRLMEIALLEMDRLNHIVTDFLTFARPPTIRKEYFDIYKLIRDILFIMKNSDDHKDDITISESLEGELFIFGDQEQLRQVCWNIGRNAIEAMPDGGEFKIEGTRNGNIVEISFSDRGKGIAKQDLEKVFYPFYTTKTKGAGLGLAISKKITEEHGGQLFVRSEGNNGTTFSLVLPVN